MAQAVDHIARSAKAGVGGWVLTPNLDIYRRLRVDPAFAELCTGPTLRLADGMPLVWASRLAGCPLPERVAGSDLIFSLSARAADDGLDVFLLGGNPGTADRTAARLRERFSSIRIVGTECPPFGFEKNPQYAAALVASIRRTSPKIIFVALGSPKQEILIQSLRPLFPACWFLGIGVTFSFVAGEVRRAPLWVQRIGLEWVHRLLQEPRRLARRYLIDGLPAAGRLFFHSLQDRFATRA